MYLDNLRAIRSISYDTRKISARKAEELNFLFQVPRPPVAELGLSSKLVAHGEDLGSKAGLLRVWTRSMGLTWNSLEMHISGPHPDLPNQKLCSLYFNKASREF